MRAPTPAETLARAHQLLAEDGRVALCQIVRDQGSTPGQVGWKLAVSIEGSAYGNLGGGSFEAMVEQDAACKLQEPSPSSEVRRYYLTEEATQGTPTGMVCGGLVEVLIEVLSEPPLLVVCGGGPVGQALAHAGSLCGYDLLVADDREAFRDASLFPSGTRVVEVDRDYTTEFLEGLAGRELLVAIVTRCWETDCAALASVLRQEPTRLGYLGLLGSQRKVDRVVNEVAQSGLSLEERPFFAPIGKSIQAQTPAEIAVSILAEVIEVRAAAQRSSAAPQPTLVKGAGAPDLPSAG